MTQNTFSIDTAFALIQSTEQFPVNFDDAWQWLEFTRKDNAKRAFDKADFIENLDYVVLLLTEGSDNHKDLSPQEKAVLQKTINIHLTIDCFKSWAMMVQTEKGKLVRQYFLECERKLKEQKAQNFTLPSTMLEAAQFAQDITSKWLLAEQDKLVLQKSLKSAEDTISGYRNVYSGEGKLSMKQAADALNLPKMGRNTLIKYLRFKNILTKDSGSIPTRYAIERGYLVVETSDWKDNHGLIHTSQSSHFTFKGFCWLVQQLKEDGHKIRQTPQAIWDNYFPAESNVVQLRVV